MKDALIDNKREERTLEEFETTRAGKDLVNSIEEFETFLETTRAGKDLVNSIKKLANE